MFRHRAPLSIILILLTAICAGSRWVGASPQIARPPMNVVLLVIDDVRWDSIGAAGNRIVQTPRIDQPAHEGIRFRQARVTTSICMVSRTTMLTGQYMSRHGITAFGKALTPEAFRERFGIWSSARRSGIASGSFNSNSTRGVSARGSRPDLAPGYRLPVNSESRLKNPRLRSLLRPQFTGTDW